MRSNACTDVYRKFYSPSWSKFGEVVTASAVAHGLRMGSHHKLMIELAAKHMSKRQDLRVLRSTPLNNASLSVSSRLNLVVAFLKPKL